MSRQLLWNDCVKANSILFFREIFEFLLDIIINSIIYIFDAAIFFEFE